MLNVTVQPDKANISFSFSASDSGLTSEAFEFRQYQMKALFLVGFLIQQLDPVTPLARASTLITFAFQHYQMEVSLLWWFHSDRFHSINKEFAWAGQQTWNCLFLLNCSPFIGMYTLCLRWLDLSIMSLSSTPAAYRLEIPVARIVWLLTASVFKAANSVPSFLPSVYCGQLIPNRTNLGFVLFGLHSMYPMCLEAGKFWPGLLECHNIPLLVPILFPPVCFPYSYLNGGTIPTSSLVLVEEYLYSPVYYVHIETLARTITKTERLGILANILQ